MGGFFGGGGGGGSTVSTLEINAAPVTGAEGFDIISFLLPGGTLAATDSMHIFAAGRISGGGAPQSVDIGVNFATSGALFSAEIPIFAAVAAGDSSSYLLYLDFWIRGNSVDLGFGFAGYGVINNTTSVSPNQEVYRSLSDSSGATVPSPFIYATNQNGPFNIDFSQDTIVKLSVREAGELLPPAQAVLWTGTTFAQALTAP